MTTSSRAFDATTDLLDWGTWGFTSSALTLSCWIYFGSFASAVDARYISKADGTGTANHDWMVGHTHNAGAPLVRIRLGRSGTTLAQAASTIVPGRWHHIGCTLGDGGAGTARLYIDGVQVATGSLGASVTTNTNPVYVGNQPTGATAAPTGNIAEPAVWSVALTAAQMASLADFATRPSDYPTGLQGYLALGDLTDSSGNSRNATNSGTTLSTAGPQYLPGVNSTHVLVNAVSSADGFGARSPSAISAAPTLLADTGYGWSPADPGLRALHAGYLTAGQLGGLETTADFTAVNTTANAKRLIYTHHYTSQPTALTNTPSVSLAGVGFMVGLYSGTGSRNTNMRVWCQGGGDSSPSLVGPQAGFVAIDPAHAASAIPLGAATQITHVTSGTFDPADIRSISWLHRASAAPSAIYWQTVSRIGYYDAYTAYKGDAAVPGKFADFYSKTQSEKHWGCAKGGATQFVFRMCLEFGHSALGNTLATYFADANISVEFDKGMEDTTTDKVRTAHYGANKVGMESKLRAGDTFKLTNAQIASPTPWHCRFATTTGATIQFINCILNNAGDIQFGPDVLFSGGLLAGCGKIALTGGTITGATIADSAAASAVSIDTAAVLNDVMFSTADATDYAIEIAAAGTYNLAGVTFDGFTTDINVTAATGTVTINVTGGGDTPTYTSAGATVVVNAGASVELTGLVAGSEIRAYVGSDPATATLLASTESSGTSFSFSQSSGGSAGFIAIRKVDRKFIKIALVYGSTDTSIPVQQQTDREYVNP